MELIGSFCIVAALGALWWAASAPRPVNQAEANLRGSRDSRQARLDEASATERILTPIARFLGDRARMFTSQGLSDRIARQLQLAGLASRYTVEQVLAARLALLIVGIVFFLTQVADGVTGQRIAFGAVGVLIMYLLPIAVLTRRAEERQRAIKLALPDVLDQITISVEAGLGFDTALARSARNGRGPFADELNRVLQDIQVGRSRDEAFESMLNRTEVDDLRKFVFAIRQAERYGLPIANVLRVQAADARERRRADAEERAAQMPVKIVFPLVLCILPPLFVVVLGPAAIDIFEQF